MLLARHGGGRECSKIIRIRNESTGGKEKGCCIGSSMQDMHLSSQLGDPKGPANILAYDLASMCYVACLR